MSETEANAGGDAPWRSEQAPCVYCGQVIDRDLDRCPHCRTSFSEAVRRASREVVGDWFYLDPRNPSGRGVSFEMLVKMIEKGRLKPESVVRGPTTHLDWMFAAETPRLAKYLGLCPHCFAEATPDQTYCTHCQLNMNERPASVRPGVPEDLVKPPFHAKAYELEKELAGEGAQAAEAPTPGPAVTPPPTPVSAGAALSAPTPPPRVSAVAAEAAAATAGASRPAAGAADGPKRPNLVVVLGLTWGTVVPLFLLLVFTGLPQLFLPAGCDDQVTQFQNKWKGMLGMGTEEVVPPEEGGGEDGDAEATTRAWKDARLRAAYDAISAGEYAQAIAIYQEVIDKTGDTTWQSRIRELRSRIEEQRRDRLDGLKEKLQLAEQMAAQRKFDDALAVLRNIGDEDRAVLAEAGVSVEKMEATFRREQQQVAEAIRQQRERLREALAKAKALRDAGKLEEARAAYEQLRAAYPPVLVKAEIDIDATLARIHKAIAEAAGPPTPPVDTMTAEEAATKVADLLEKAAGLEQQEKFAEALETLESIKTLDRKYWPENLEERIEDVRKRKEALDFFGLDG